MATAEFMMDPGGRAPGVTVRAKREPVLPDLAVRREQQVVAASVQYIAKHVIMNLMWIAMLFTPIRKKSNQLGTSIYFHGTAESSTSVHPCQKRAKKQDHQVSTTEGMIDMMTVVRDMTPRRRSRAVLTPPPTGVSIHEHRRIEYRDATVQILIVDSTCERSFSTGGIDLIIQSGTVR
jgi:hypothetical protein